MESDDRRDPLQAMQAQGAGGPLDRIPALMRLSFHLPVPLATPLIKATMAAHRARRHCWLAVVELLAGWWPWWAHRQVDRALKASQAEYCALREIGARLSQVEVC